MSQDYSAFSLIQINELLRMILVRWLTEIHHKMNLCQETLFLAVNIIDRFLARMVIIPESLQMIGLTSLFIASKYVSKKLLHPFYPVHIKSSSGNDLWTSSVLSANWSFVLVPDQALSTESQCQRTSMKTLF